MNKEETEKKFPVYGWFGIMLIVVFWILNWTLGGLRTHWGFFPLWLGYCLTIDSLVFMKKGTSMIHRNVFVYVLLFIISIPVWWLFEFFNKITQNWFYIGSEFFSPTEYFLLASLSFSTVMPAVFGTAELAGTFRWIKKNKEGPRINPDPKTAAVFFAGGSALIFLLILFPSIFYPVLWISIYFIVESINITAGNTSLAEYTKNKDWRIVISLFTGCMICAFFWEMWNYYSYPKWIYRLPYVHVLEVFEMPLPGYIGYLPFSLELFALYNLTGFLRNKELRNFLQI